MSNKKALLAVDLRTLDAIIRRDLVSNTKQKRGFALLDSARRREIAALGGYTAHANGSAHKFTSEQARLAGKKHKHSAAPRSRRRSSRGASAVLEHVPQHSIASAGQCDAAMTPTQAAIPPQSLLQDRVLSEFKAALQFESRVWHAVQHRLLRGQEFDESAWQEWMDAADQANAAAAQFSKFQSNG